eukprot:5899799-Heterocapsa_arctica.AAC.1
MGKMFRLKDAIKIMEAGPTYWNTRKTIGARPHLLPTLMTPVITTYFGVQGRPSVIDFIIPTSMPLVKFCKCPAYFGG